MCSLNEYKEQLKDKPFKWLLDERSKLLQSIVMPEQHPNIDSDTEPSPATIHQTELDCFSSLCEYLREHHFSEYKKNCLASFTRGELIGIIDRTIKTAWCTSLVTDYSKDYLLKEDALKCALYYHLRRNLALILAEHGLRIYPEYYIPELKYRADMVIVQLNSNSEAHHLKNRVADVLALIELKYTYGHTDAVISSIKRDIAKMKQYVSSGFKAQCYCGILYEDALDFSSWTDKRTTNHWANGNLTLLTADLREGYIWFKIKNYNGLNAYLVDTDPS